jgi:hypothetical protein
MEDVLDLYEEPYDPTRPKVNVEETSQPLIAETRVPLPPKPGKPARYDYAYQRNGTRHLFLFCAPHVGWRHIAVTAQRTMEDCAEHMRWLVDVRYPEAEVIRVVLDNLNTHKTSTNPLRSLKPVPLRKRGAL